MNRRSNGMTFIEIVVVVAIIALLAAAVSIRASGWFTSTRFQSVTGQMIYIDSLARQYTRRSGQRVELIFDLSAGEMHRQEPVNESDLRAHRFQLPRGYAIKQIQTAYDRVRSGQATIPCSTLGQTPTYAIQLSGPNQRQQWVVIVGLTGQVVELDNDQAVNNLFAKLAS